MKKIVITEKQKNIIEVLNHPLYTVDFLQEWVNREENVDINAVAALQVMGANGFFSAVKAIENWRDQAADIALIEMALEALDECEISDVCIEDKIIFDEAAFRVTVREALQERLASEWILCSEALPKANGEYLVTIKTAKGSTILEFVQDRNGGHVWRDCCNDCYTVTAWKPLPEAYRE